MTDRPHLAGIDAGSDIATVAEAESCTHDGRRSRLGNDSAQARRSLICLSRTSTANRLPTDADPAVVDAWKNCRATHHIQVRGVIFKPLLGPLGRDRVYVRDDAIAHLRG